MAKMKNCKYCGMEIPGNAKVCPYCRRKLKGGKLKWILIVLGVLLVFGALGSGGSKNKDEDKGGKVGSVENGQVVMSNAETAESAAETGADDAAAVDSEDAQDAAAETGADDAAAQDTAEESAESTTEENMQTVYHVGDVLEEDNLQIIYMSSGEYEESNEFLQPSEGNTYYFMEFAFKNISETSDASVSMYEFKGYADGYSVDQYFGGDDQLSGTLSPGRTTYGKVFYEVPIDTASFEVEYESNVFTNKKLIFAYEGNQDSGYQVEKNAARSENACNVGDTLEEGNLKITYLSCEEYTEDNMFLTPKDGCHYISCEFEFENIGSSDQYVSAYEFDCYADGITCNLYFGRDDSLSATLSAGRKAKGTVTFEVPDDAECVEAEYLTNVWTSNRLIFTIR